MGPRSRPNGLATRSTAGTSFPFKLNFRRIPGREDFGLLKSQKREEEEEEEGEMKRKGKRKGKRKRERKENVKTNGHIQTAEQRCCMWGARVQS